MKLSAVVITKNEENRIKACLESVKWADEIVVVDNGSTDKTLEVLSNIKNQISNIKIYKFNDTDFASLRNKAMEQAKGDWVFYVDADERVLDPLKKEIEVMISFANFPHMQSPAGMLFSELKLDMVRFGLIG